LDTLAAGHAAAGDFEHVLALAHQARALAQGREDLAGEIGGRARGYESGAAYVAPVQC
jgi:hypothetical protein